MSFLNTLRFIANHPMNKRDRVGAFVRFARWQLGSRLVPGQVVYHWVNGAKFIVQPGEWGLTGNVYCGLHEFTDMAYLLHVVGEDDLFIDVGANVGSYTLLACAARGARGYCFEPVPDTFSRLMDNLHINDLMGRVEALNVGLSDQNGELLFTTDENCANHVVADGESSPSEVVRVPVVRLDDVLHDQAPSLMKIDVEGFETPVLAGASQILQNPSLHSVIMELNGSGARYGYSEDAILDTMRGYGFSTYAYDPFTRTLTSLHGKNATSGNTLFIRDMERVRPKLRRAEPVDIDGVRL